MVLYLLGIPLAIAAAKMLHDDVKYTAMDLRIEKASSDVNIQYKQIEKNFVDILKYSGAKCDIKKKGYDNYEIKNVQKGQYGGMEKYLGEKGFYPQAINHAKKLFDNIADKESRIKNQNRDKRINTFERKLLTEKTNDTVITILFNKFSCDKSKFLVEKDVEKLIEYFHAHNNKNVFCNIIMENDNYWHHKEVWHIKEPISENAKKYYNDVYDKIIINNHTISTTNESHEPNLAPKSIPQEVLENKSEYIRYGMSYRGKGNNEKALKYFKKVLDIDPEFTTALIKAGYCLMDLGRYEEAVEYLERVKYPYDREVAKHIEYCYSKLRNHENPNQSKYDNKKEEDNDSYSINTNSNNIDKDSVYYFKLGLQYKNSINDAEKEEAVKYFKKAIDLNPNFSKAFKQLGYTLEELEKYEEAIEYLERVGSDDRFVSQHIQNCYSKLGQSINKHVETEDYNSDSQKNPNDKYENKLSSINFDSRSNDSISASSILELDNEELNNELNINFHEDYNEVDYLSKIKQAKELLDDGAITQEEYNILKRKFLDLI